VQEKILARYGKVFDWSVKARMMGKTTAESTRILFEECGLTGLLTPEEFLEERETMLKQLLPTSVAMPGEEDGLSNFSVHGTTLSWYFAMIAQKKSFGKQQTSCIAGRGGKAPKFLK